MSVDPTRARSPGIDTEYVDTTDGTIDTAEATEPLASKHTDSLTDTQTAPSPAPPRPGTPTVTPTTCDTIKSAAPLEVTSQPQPDEAGLVQIFKDLFCRCLSFCRGGEKRSD